MNWTRSTYNKYYGALSDRNTLLFGILMLAVIAGLYFVVPHEWKWSIGVLAALQLPGFIYRALFRVEYAVLSLITFPVGFSVSLLVLFILYLLVITPIGMFRKNKYPVGWHSAEKDIDPEKMFE